MNTWIERRSYGVGHDRRPFNSLDSDSDYKRDRARIVHSAAFRRLQYKTQILNVGESDFYRTRLTHSLEVAQIGSGICDALREQYRSNEVYCEWIPSLPLIETICLSHDLGHPPFGHGGEIALNFFMIDSGGFEGNGQTLRIASRLGEYSQEHGLDLTRRAMLGLLKYPCIHKTLCNYHEPLKIKTNSTNIDYCKPPKCVHDDENDVVEWTLLPFENDERGRFRNFTRGNEKHGKSNHKSFDTSIMELADDIAYGVHDLEDALALRLVTAKQWKEEVVDLIEDLPDNEIKRSLKFYNLKLFAESSNERKHAISKLVHYLISNIIIEEKNEFHHQLLKLQARMCSPASEILKFFKEFVMKHVIKSPEVQALEFKGQQMVFRLFEVFLENPDRLLPKTTNEKYNKSENKKRIICDYVAGMSDSYAAKQYKKLFSPDVGSIFDRI